MLLHLLPVLEKVLCAVTITRDDNLVAETPLAGGRALERLVLGRWSSSSLPSSSSSSSSSSFLAVSLARVMHLALFGVRYNTLAVGRRVLVVASSSSSLSASPSATVIVVIITVIYITTSPDLYDDIKALIVLSSYMYKAAASSPLKSVMGPGPCMTI